MNIQLKAEELTIFHSFEEWVNKASGRLGGFERDQKIICLDKNGNSCNGGTDFMHARDHDLFPVTAYRLIRSSETI